MIKSEGIFDDAAETSLPSSDDEEIKGNDYDTCNAIELEQFFQTKYRKSDEIAATLQKEYVLSLCTDSAFTQLAAGLSNGEVQMFDIKCERSLSRSSVELKVSSDPRGVNMKSKTNSICGVQFLDDASANCLLIGTTNGLVRLYDLRTNRVEARFEEGVPDSRRHILCFGRNANGRILCTGTEKYQNSVYIFFYDVRQRKQLGAYFDSHDDDITSLSFHSINPDLLCSGATDGLINVFDIKQSTEEDALLTTLNTEESVQKLNWHKNVYEKDLISCISHTNFKVYDCDESDLIVELDRNKITSTMKRNDSSNCNLINAHNMDDNGIFVLAGTYLQNGDVLRALHLQNKNLTPLADFDGNKQIVRESIFNSKNGALITAGESGLITLWTPESFGQEGQLISISNKLKSKVKKESKKNPY